VRPKLKGESAVSRNGARQGALPKGIVGKAQQEKALSRGIGKKNRSSICAEKGGFTRLANGVVPRVLERSAFSNRSKGSCAGTKKKLVGGGKGKDHYQS